MKEAAGQENRTAERQEEAALRAPRVEGTAVLRALVVPSPVPDRAVVPVLGRAVPLLGRAVASVAGARTVEPVEAAVCNNFS